MSEDAQQVSSKAAKKNLKRNCKKVSSKPDDSKNDSFSPETMLVELKKLLSEAKANKEHAQAATLRSEIWVLNDLVNGVKTKIPEEDLDEIIENIHSRFRVKSDQPAAPVEESATAETNSTASTVVVTERVVPLATASTAVISSGFDDRKLRNLRKKLEQVNALKERQKNGEKLEANQLEKIKGETKLKEEIQELEDLIKDLLKS